MNSERRGRPVSMASEEGGKKRPEITDFPVPYIQPVTPNGPRETPEVPVEDTISPERAQEILDGNKEELEEEPN